MDKSKINVKANLLRTEIIVSFFYSEERLALVRELLAPEPVYKFIANVKKFDYWRLPLSEEHYLKLVALKEDERFEIAESALSMYEVLKEWEEENFRLAQIKEDESPLMVRGVQLSKYVQAAVNYAVRNTGGVILNDPVNLDRIYTALAVIHLHAKSPTLVVCDVINKPEWFGLLKRLYPNDSVAAVNGKRDLNESPLTDYLVINYDMLEYHEEYIKSLEWGAVIFDSCEKLKNQNARWSQTAARIAELIPAKFALTGFDLCNDPEGLLNILKTIKRLDDLGGFWWFANHYCLAKKNPAGKWDFSGKANLNELRVKMQRVCYIRRTDYT